MISKSLVIISNMYFNNILLHENVKLRMWNKQHSGYIRIWQIVCSNTQIWFSAARLFPIHWCILFHMF